MKFLLFIGFWLMQFACVGQVQSYNFGDFTCGWGDKGVEWVSYRLTREMVEADTNSFERPGFRNFGGVYDSDYTHTGYDRGHLAAAKTFSYNYWAFWSTFTLANIAPMRPGINRRVWYHLERYERAVALEEGCLFVVIRVNYEDAIRVGALWIPVSFERLIYDCNMQLLGVFEIKNIDY